MASNGFFIQDLSAAASFSANMAFLVEPTASGQSKSWYVTGVQQKAFYDGVYVSAGSGWISQAAADALYVSAGSGWLSAGVADSRYVSAGSGWVSQAAADALYVSAGSGWLSAGVADARYVSAGSGWISQAAADALYVSAGSGWISAVAQDTSPQLGGNLDCKGFQIVASSGAATAVLDLSQGAGETEFIKLQGTGSAGAVTHALVDVQDVTFATLVGYLKINVVDAGDQVSDGAYHIPFYKVE